MGLETSLTHPLLKSARDALTTTLCQRFLDFSNNKTFLLLIPFFFFSPCSLYLSVSMSMFVPFSYPSPERPLRSAFNPRQRFSRRPTLRPINEPSIPQNITLPTKALDLPRHIELAFTNCGVAAARVIISLEALSKRRQSRFEALCPTNDAIRLTRHCKAVNRLIAWREDYNIFSPTFAPTPKLTRMNLAGVHVNRTAYEAWAEAYRSDVLLYIHGPFSQYRRLKRDFLEEVQAARAVVMDEEDARVLEWLFLNEMDKWEPCVKRLQLPSYDELLNEVYRAIRCWAEGADELLAELRDTQGVTL
ncbi:hypothetical protein BDW74DRAFT_49884 [Aspergillus multicolor]|uniref:uncharacterized protein n=1 Tax=Aspergillus multicolor TaxID=41759 RepID=UPI003CCE25A2